MLLSVRIIIKHENPDAIELSPSEPGSQADRFSITYINKEGDFVQALDYMVGHLNSDPEKA